MELRDYIEQGEKAAGGRIALAETLGLPHANNITNAKSGQRGLPLAACYKLADLIGERRDAIAAASALVTEKDESVRNYLRPFVQMGRLAHPMIAPVVMTLSALIVALENSATTVGNLLL